MRPSEALERHREEIRALIATYPLAEPRLFGSTARGEDGEASDLDIMVKVVGPMGYFELFRLQNGLKELTGVAVDIRTEGEFSPTTLGRIARDLRPL